MLQRNWSSRLWFAAAASSSAEGRNLSYVALLGWLLPLTPLAPLLLPPPLSLPLPLLLPLPPCCCHCHSHSHHRSCCCRCLWQSLQ